MQLSRVPDPVFRRRAPHGGLAGALSEITIAVASLFMHVLSCLRGLGSCPARAVFDRNREMGRAYDGETVMRKMHHAGHPPSTTNQDRNKCNDAKTFEVVDTPLLYRQSWSGLPTANGGADGADAKPLAEKWELWQVV
jgi:hypothetical protein